jgi:hypothetical protein
MAEALAEATELMTGLLVAELVPNEDTLVSVRLLPDRVEDADEDEAKTDVVAEEVTEEVGLARVDDPGRLLLLREAVEEKDERLVDVEADPEEEVIEAVTEPEAEEVSSPGSGVSVGSPSSSCVMVEVGISSPSVIVISSSSLEVETGFSLSVSEDVELVVAVGVMLADDMSMTMELTLVEVELATADDDIVEDDCVAVVVVVGPMEVLLPGMRLR